LIHLWIVFQLDSFSVGVVADSAFISSLFSLFSFLLLLAHGLVVFLCYLPPLEFLCLFFQIKGLIES